ncbi:MAG: hypothetical protein JNK11_08375, partial [Alphaproteobacteria bacterium]|nr:hypothetical protein [Alphaproteobacteria bacterium]
MTTQPLPRSSSSFTLIAEGGGERTVGVQVLRERLGADGLASLPERDHALLQSLRNAYVHFTLECTSNEVGRLYAVLPIVAAGFRTLDGQEVVPALDPGRCNLGRCIDVMQRVPIDSVPSDLFEHSLPTIRTHDELAAALIGRYAPLFPRMARQELLSRGCAL